MTLEFIIVQFQKGCKIYKGVFEKSRMSDIQAGSFTCTSHCQIEIDGENYVVLWELVKSKVTHIEDTFQPSDSDEQSENGEHIEYQLSDTDHCLPFKVLGTCYSSDQQKALDEAYSYLEEYNRPVFVKLEA
jgi:hypothetical protein